MITRILALYPKLKQTMDLLSDTHTLGMTITARDKYRRGIIDAVARCLYAMRLPRMANHLWQPHLNACCRGNILMNGWYVSGRFASLADPDRHFGNSYNTTEDAVMQAALTTRKDELAITSSERKQLSREAGVLPFVGHIAPRIPCLRDLFLNAFRRVDRHGKRTLGTFNTITLPRLSGLLVDTESLRAMIVDCLNDMGLPYLAAAHFGVLRDRPLGCFNFPGLIHCTVAQRVLTGSLSAAVNYYQHDNARVYQPEEDTAIAVALAREESQLQFLEENQWRQTPLLTLRSMISPVV